MEVLTGRHINLHALSTYCWVSSYLENKYTFQLLFMYTNTPLMSIVSHSGVHPVHIFLQHNTGVGIRRIIFSAFFRQDSVPFWDIMNKSSYTGWMGGILINNLRYTVMAVWIIFSFLLHFFFFLYYLFLTFFSLLVWYAWRREYIHLSPNSTFYQFVFSAFPIITCNEVRLSSKLI